MTTFLMITSTLKIIRYWARRALRIPTNGAFKALLTRIGSLAKVAVANSRIANATFSGNTSKLRKAAEVQAISNPVI